jgi:hypothetical protein
VVVVCVGLGESLRRSWKWGAGLGARRAHHGGRWWEAPGEGDGNCRIMRRLRRERVENGVGSGQP